MSYCKYVLGLEKDNVHRVYHDEHYGLMLDDDNEIFGRLILEINQAGLSWNTILKKEKNFKKAYSSYNIKKIAKYNEEDIERLMKDFGIIRNRLKINAVIHNASIILNLDKEAVINVDKGKPAPKARANKSDKNITFRDWLIYNYKNNIYTDKITAAKYFKKSGFKFVGGEIIGEFLMSLGLLPGGHDTDCKYYKRSHFSKS